MPWTQREITLRARPRGVHLVTDEIVDALPELEGLHVGVAQLFIRHTSASLTLNENASPDVRRDFESWFDDAVPEGAPYWTHTSEGADDMPAHVPLDGGQGDVDDRCVQPDDERPHDRCHQAQPLAALVRGLRAVDASSAPAVVLTHPRA